MRVEVSVVLRAPVDRVWAWWTDFGQPGDKVRMKHGFVTSQREILRADATGAEFVDRAMGGFVKRTVTLGEGRRFHERARGGAAYEAEWRFEEAGEGATRVVRVFDTRAKGAALLGPLARWGTRQMLLIDLRSHAREAERELAPGGR